MDWDLQAIVRGCSSETEAPHPNFPHLYCEQHRDDLTFPEFSETTSVLDELAELYKPFYPVLHPLSPQTIATSTSSLPMPQEVKPPPQDSQNSPESKCKRSKKSQNKRVRVVKQVRAEGLCDTWAWRKYGQKPIKGSLYPRSYYKCSTSKGCLARKQVERCHLNPEVFMVTYTAEHSHHHHPPRRNSSLSGTTRKNKYLNVVAPKIAENYSPRTPLKDAIEDEIVPSGQSQDLILKKQAYVVESSTGDEAVTSDALASDDWFPSLDELNGLGQEFALDDCFGGDTFSV